MKLFFLFFILIFQVVTQAKPAPQPAPKSAPATPSTSLAPAAATPANATPAAVALPPGSSPWTLTTRGWFWNENLQVQENGVKSEYKGQFTAIAIGGSHQNPLGNRRWIHTKNFEVILGAAHVTGQSGGYNDFLKNQMAFGILLSTGLTYRTTKISEISFNIPIFFRTTQWKVNRSTLNLYNQEITSFGLEMASTLRFTPTKSFLFGFTFIQAMPTAIWKVGIDSKF